MHCKTLLACLMAGALGIGLMACSDDDSGTNNNNNGTDPCGNGVIDTGEQCDGAELGGETCVTQGMSGGFLDCTATCTFDLSACLGCGNGQIEVGEVCDGTNLDGQTCVDVGNFIGGTLACGTDCTGYDTSGCDENTEVCPTDETVTLTYGHVVQLSVDTANEDDTTEVSCEENGAANANDRVYLITVADDGDLAVSYSSDWLVFGLFPEPTNLADCFNPGDELGCYDAYADGPTGVFTGLTAGNYHLVVADWNSTQSQSIDFFLTFYPAGGEICSNGIDDDGDGYVDCADSDCAAVAFCMAEDCGNGEDDDLNGLTDCMDWACVGSTDCTGGVCTADHDLGTVTSALDATVVYDTTTASDDYDLACGTPGSPEFVISFHLDATSIVTVDFNQGTVDANLVGFYLEGAPGSTCIDQEYFCFAPGATSISGSLTSEAMPPGSYYFIIEADNGGGAGTAHFTVALVCAIGEHDEGGVCTPNTCQATDLGTYAGTQIVTQGDSCTGMAAYFPQGGCTGWPANAEELVYSITVPDGSNIDVTQTPINGATQDSALYLLASCTDWQAAGCLAGADDTLDGEAETLTYTNSTGADQVVYIVADAYAGCGDFELTID